MLDLIKNRGVELLDHFFQVVECVFSFLGFLTTVSINMQVFNGLWHVSLLYS